MLCLFVIGCSKEESSERTIVPSTTSINADWQGLHFHYYVTNSSGITTNEFQYGDDVVFHLHVTNNTDTDFIGEELHDFLKNSWFTTQMIPLLLQHMTQCLRNLNWWLYQHTQKSLGNMHGLMTAVRTAVHPI